MMHSGVNVACAFGAEHGLTVPRAVKSTRCIIESLCRNLNERKERPALPLAIESETFEIDKPDELGEYSSKLWDELVLLVPERKGKIIRFESMTQARRVTNDLALIAGQSSFDAYVEKVKKSTHHKVYLRPKEEESK